MAVALVAGFVLTSRQELRGQPGSAGMWDYSFTGLILWLTGSSETEVRPPRARDHG